MNPTAPSYSHEAVSKAWRMIEQATHITLLTHDKPDADGISACAALDHLLAKLGKTVETIYPSTPERDQSRQARTVFINKHQQIPDLIIACDTANYKRLYYPDAFKSIPLLNIDHHISNSIAGTCNLVNAAASSTCEELVLIIRAWGPLLIDTQIAECLLFGMLYDGQVFQTQAITSTTLRLAADLMDRGANLYELKTELLTDKDPKIIKLWGAVLSSIRISANGKAAWARITQADLHAAGVGLPGLVGLVNFLNQISEVDVTALFYEKDANCTKVSLRSRTADVNAVAAKFGGGGHKFASGIEMNKPIDEAIALVTPLL
jgi:phosphoesterase RecJ-like protein